MTNLEKNEKHAWDLYQVFSDTGEEVFLNRFADDTFDEVLDAISEDHDNLEINKDETFDTWFWVGLEEVEDYQYRIQLFQ